MQSVLPYDDAGCGAGLSQVAWKEDFKCPHFGVVEDTLFVPMQGRIYASEHCPNILYDPKALETEKKTAFRLPEQDGQSQYTLLASAARSANMDRFIRPFWSAGRTV